MSEQNQPESPEAMAARINEAINHGHYEDSEHVIVDLMKEIEKRPQIPENVFRELFLPHFAGTSKDGEAGMRNAIEHWTGLVGGNTEAELIDTAGNVSVIVPPLFDDNMISNNYKTSLSRVVENAMNAYADDAKQLPARANAELAVTSAEIVSDVLKNNAQAVEKNTQAWANLFAHFGLLPKTSENSSVGPAAPIPDDMQFD